MSKVIIGIHGLANKPKASVLTKYWKDSISEGLRNVGVRNPRFTLAMVHWAKYLYRYPLHIDTGFEFDPLFNSEPYLKSAKKPKEFKDSWKDALLGMAGSKTGAGFEWMKRKLSIDRLADAVLGAKLKDLDYYYQEKRIKGPNGKMKSAKQVLRKELADTLLANQQHEVMLIAHSMGTIIAYDVLRVMGHKGPKVQVAHFITIGSPLGLAHVKNEIIKERKAEKRPKAATLRTPSIVTGSWVNYADRLDPVALDSHLSDDYGENSAKVRVVDDRVSNGYVGTTGEPNHHKSYGYLRTPELSRKIKQFLAR